MTLLFRVIYAAHASGSHHKLALDALLELQGPGSEGWRRLFLKHADAYLEGSKAPDTEFKDFKNHVIHVTDGYWGGAVEQAQAWYGRLVEELGAGRWPEAVYSAGVLSHYVVDPIHPFHTGQSEAESNIHRAVEWSIAKSYDDLRQLPFESEPCAPLPDGADWLSSLVVTGAVRAHRHYDTLLVHYDFDKGVADPPAGLGAPAQYAIAGLIAYAASAFALVLDRAFEESGAAPPEVSLSLETVLATLTVPQKWVLNRIADHGERRRVAAMYAELSAKGCLEQTLPEEIRTVRETHAREARAIAKQRQVSQRLQSIARTEPAPVPPNPPAELAREAQPKPVSSAVPFPVHSERGPRLASGDPVEAAPSIGPRTSERLAEAGVTTVSDLVAADAEALAARLAARHIDAEVVRAWQDQTRLALALPALNGTNAQLLVAVGYRSLEALGRADPAMVCEAMAQFAVTPEGERILRDGRLPSKAAIARLIEAAQCGAVRAA